MTTWRARLGVAAVFAAGVVCGAAGLWLVSARATFRSLHEPGVWADRATRRLGRQLDLSAAQRDQVHAILTDARRETAAALRVKQPRLLAAFDHAQARIREVLTPEQRARFAKISARRRARLIERWGGPSSAPAPADPPPAAAPRAGPPPAAPAPPGAPAPSATP